MKFFYLLIGLVIHTGLYSQTNSTKEIALRYMEAYGAWDFDTMKTFYADTVSFEDPTGTEAFKQTFSFQGKENVYTFFKNVFKNRFQNNKPPYVHFTIEKSFFTETYAVINSTFECIIPTSWFDKNSNESILIAIPFVTVLTIKDGLITKHIDYGNYTKYHEQIKAQMKK